MVGSLCMLLVEITRQRVEIPRNHSFRGGEVHMKRACMLIIVALALLLPLGWAVRVSTYARQDTTGIAQRLTVMGTWNAHNYDLVYTVAFSNQQQPDGPLVAYR